MAIQLITNSKITKKIKVGDEIEVRGALDIIKLICISCDGQKAKLQCDNFVAWLRKESDGWYYDHTLREAKKRVRASKVVDETQNSV